MAEHHCRSGRTPAVTATHPRQKITYHKLAVLACLQDNSIAGEDFDMTDKRSTCTQRDTCDRDPDHLQRLTNLASYRTHQHHSADPDRCPRFAHVVGDTRLACMRTCCPVCVRAVAVEAARAIALARPTHSYRLSLVGSQWSDIHDNMTGFVRRVRRRVTKFEHAWHIEANPAGTGNHVHGWFWGATPTQHLLREAAVVSGMGADVWMGSWRVASSADALIDYGMKAVTGPGLGRSDEAKEFLALNGGRVMHASRGFYRDAITGELLANRRDAERRVRLHRGAAARSGTHR